jgi:protein SCO1
MSGRAIDMQVEGFVTERADLLPALGARPGWRPCDRAERAAGSPTWALRSRGRHARPSEQSALLHRDGRLAADNVAIEEWNPDTLAGGIVPAVRNGRQAILLALVGLSSIVGEGCRRVNPPSVSERVFALRGVVVKVLRAERRLTVRHEDILNFMPAMTMTFAVGRDGGDLGELSAGDQITAELHVAGTDFHLEHITVIGSEKIPRLDASKILPPGAPVPDVSLTDQDGRPISLSGFRGEILLVSFIYTRCPLPWACPATISKLARVATAAPEARFHVLLVTLDPKNDTPAVLKDYARQVDLSSGRWSFATGDPAAIQSLAERLGVLAYADGSQITHSLGVVVIGSDGRILTRHDGRDWTPEEVVKDLKPKT